MRLHRVWRTRPAKGLEFPLHPLQAAEIQAATLSDDLMAGCFALYWVYMKNNCSPHFLTLASSTPRWLVGEHLKWRWVFFLRRSPHTRRTSDGLPLRPPGSKRIEVTYPRSMGESVAAHPKADPDHQLTQAKFSSGVLTVMTAATSA